MDKLDDTYTLVAEVGYKPEDVCDDGCVYTRNNTDIPVDCLYCFKTRQSYGLSNCQVGYRDLGLESSRGHFL